MNWIKCFRRCYNGVMTITPNEDYTEVVYDKNIIVMSDSILISNKKPLQIWLNI